MERVTGIGGVIFKAKDAVSLQAWFKRHLGINVQEWGGAAFSRSDSNVNSTGGMTIWSIASQQANQFMSTISSFMINHRALVEVRKSEGGHVLDILEESESSLCARLNDPEGNKVELWKPLEGM